MDRSFESVRRGANEVSARRLMASRAMKKEEKVLGQKLAEMAKMHFGEGFYALDDRLEAAIFSALVGIMKELKKRKEDLDT
jgi:hypothetical protein